MNSRMKSRANTSGSTTDSSSISAVASAAVSFEYASLRHRSHCPLGIYVVPSKESLFIWDAIFFVHQGYYADGIFKFRLLFPPNYPDRPPTVQFTTDMFHPLISANGIFNLAPRFHPWRPKEHFVFHVLHYIKASFKKPVLDKITEADCLNKEAYRYHDSTGSFASLATQSSLLSQSPSSLFERDLPSSSDKSHGMILRELKPQQLQEMRTKLGLAEWDEE
ncbi:UBC-like protein [Desarmillaria tabescens]|uniref:UBC-like protein n=1 Tax=Armillaria tabescens TaxID=1929756 RepID=A0AA39NML6_ARMTA|nr:UBC-like protein [Desarmillaria tabescens]KAK0468350.1 UBC-like protein [Desarmillaria tabescens]